MKVGFRVDSSNKIGLGHLHRSISLANEFKKQKAKTFFFTSNFINNFDGLIKKKGLYLQKLNKKLVSEKNFKKKAIINDALKVVKIIKKQKLDLIFLDSNKLDLSWEKIVSRHCKIVLISDYLQRKSLCDYLICYHLTSKPYYYKKFLIKDNCKILSDAQYSIIKKNNINKASNHKKNNILIYMGGADKKNISFKLKKIFEKDDYKKFNFYILPSNKDQKVKFENLNLKDNFKIVKSKDQSLYSIANKFDLIILGFGTSVYELSHSSKKLLILVQNQISKKISNNIKEFNLFNFIYSLKDLNKNFINKSFDIKDSKLKELGSIYDGKGAKRIVQFFTRNYNDIKLREFKSIDKYFLFRLANDPSVRKSSLNKKKITLKEHLRWFKKVFTNNKENFLLKLKSKDLKIGQIRLEKKKKSLILDYSISNEFRGNNFGKKMIKMAIKKIRYKKNILAKSLSSNSYSISTLKKSGFIITKKNNKVYNYSFSSS